MAKKRKSRFASEAALQSLVRFGPETSGLRELQREAESELATRVAQAHGSARGLEFAIGQARPQVAQTYDQAGLTQAALNQTLIGHDLAGLGNVADSIKAGAALEAASMGGRLNEAKSAALTDLSQRRVQARQGEQFAVQNAQDQFVDSVVKILQRKQDLAREKGAFTASTTGQLREVAQNRADKLTIAREGNQQSERNSKRSAGIDPDTGNPIPGGKLDPKQKGPKLQTPQQHTAVADKVSQGMQALATLDPHKAERHEQAQLLVTGVKSMDVYDPTSGKKKISSAGTPVQTPEVPGIGGLLASVAADMYYDGHVSRKNQQRLNQARLSVRKLGLTSYGDWKRSGGRQRSTSENLRAVRDALTLGG